jgi:hypothetical protein
MIYCLYSKNDMFPVLVSNRVDMILINITSYDHIEKINHDIALS